MGTYLCSNMEDRFCVQCGAPLSPDGKFCEECGAPVPIELVSPIPPPPEEPAPVPRPIVPKPERKAIPRIYFGIALIVGIILVALVIAPTFLSDKPAGTGLQTVPVEPMAKATTIPTAVPDKKVTQKVTAKPTIVSGDPEKWMPSSSTTNKIPAGGEVFLGEKGLDVSAATGGASQIAWWQSGTNTDTEQPADIQQVTNAQSFYVSPDTFIGKTGNWYQWNGRVKGPLAFNIKEPSLNLKIWDGSVNEDVTGKAIPVGNYGNFVVETNMQSIITRPGFQPADAPFKIKVKSADGGVYTNLIGNNGKEIALTALAVNQKLWYWVSPDNKHTEPASNDGWNTAAKDKYGNRMYKAGTYTVWAECNANGMKNQYTAPDGSDYTGKTISAVKSVQIVTD